MVMDHIEDGIVQYRRWLNDMTSTMLDRIETKAEPCSLRSAAVEIVPPTLSGRF